MSNLRKTFTKYISLHPSAVESLVLLRGLLEETRHLGGTGGGSLGRKTYEPEITHSPALRCIWCTARVRN